MVTALLVKNPVAVHLVVEITNVVQSVTEALVILAISLKLFLAGVVERLPRCLVGENVEPGLQSV